MPALTLTPINGEPRIQDVLLGKRLGFERPRDIRKLIERHLENLNKINHCATVARGITISLAGSARIVEGMGLSWQPQHEKLKS